MICWRDTGHNYTKIVVLSLNIAFFVPNRAEPDNAAFRLGLHSLFPVYKRFFWRIEPVIRIMVRIIWDTSWKKSSFYIGLDVKSSFKTDVYSKATQNRQNKDLYDK